MRVDTRTNETKEAIVDKEENAEGMSASREGGIEARRNEANEERDDRTTMEGNSQEDIRRTPANQDNFHTARETAAAELTAAAWRLAKSNVGGSKRC
jgi:hypothetical protein